MAPGITRQALLTITYVPAELGDHLVVRSLYARCANRVWSIPHIPHLTGGTAEQDMS